MFKKGRISMMKQKIMLGLISMHASVVLAGIPRLPSGTTQGNTNFIEIAWSYTKTGLMYAAIGACALSMITASSLCWKELAEARRTGEWGNFGKVAGVSAGLLVLTIIAANFAKDTLA